MLNAIQIIQIARDAFRLSHTHPTPPPPQSEYILYVWCIMYAYHVMRVTFKIYPNYAELCSVDSVNEVNVIWARPPARESETHVRAGVHSSVCVPFQMELPAYAHTHTQKRLARAQHDPRLIKNEKYFRISLKRCQTKVMNMQRRR